MKTTDIYKLDFKIDKLTDSIRNTISGHLMIIDTIAAKRLVDKYFKPE